MTPLFKFFTRLFEWRYDASHFTVPQVRTKIMFTCAMTIYLPSIRCKKMCNRQRDRQPNGAACYKKKNYGIDARAKKKARPLSPARVLILENLSVGMLRSRPLLVRTSPMDCQAPRQKLRRNTPTHPPLCNPYVTDSPLCGTDADPHR